MASLTWLGHASFRLTSDEGNVIYVDPFLNGNPSTPPSELEPARIDVIALTHGHGDHLGDTVELCRRFPEAQVIAIVELKAWLAKQVESVGEQAPGTNKGGSQEVDGVRFTLVNALHSSSTPDGGYAGEPCGIVVRLESGTSVYFAGDTSVFGDLALIRRLYAPDLAVLPIGDHYTMGPAEAAVALELLGNPACVPCHYGTWPMLTGTPEELARLAPESKIHGIEPGETLEL